ncbi:YcxB family protein [Streptomyces sp. TBY4]|uniref:YcxB family protein n=1 Tax=Streptomyces sp. TBY4 TaxID=2962030 RepID=UPI0020B695A4|nr:YcxB family protein [Streptomyces sp. TBY4]MCP3755931.1 YcxB family protein [Streptomyces sp. TBY4]
MDDTSGDQLYRIHESASAGRAVELRYTPTIADMAEGLRARGRSKVGRRQRLPFFLVGLVGPGYAVVLIAQNGESGGSAVGLTAVGLLGWAFALFGHRLMAWSTRGLLAAAGECRAFVDGEGVTVESAQGSTHLRWSALAGYAETPATFMVFTGDKQIIGGALLPKRGLAGPGQQDVLRAILDRNLKRL